MAARLIYTNWQSLAPKNIYLCYGSWLNRKKNGGCGGAAKYQVHVVAVHERSTMLNDSGLNSWRQGIRIRSVCLLISPEPPESHWADGAVQRSGGVGTHRPGPNSTA